MTGNRPIKTLRLTGAVILLSRSIKVLQTATATEVGRSAASELDVRRWKDSEAKA